MIANDIFYTFSRRSEFIGCLSVLVKQLLDNKNVDGTFMLQPQSCLVKPMPLVHETEDKLSKIEETFLQIQDEKDDNILLKYLELNNLKGSCARTPFTLTKTIVKQADETFGFEISWSKPPKVNSVKENSLHSGLMKGDYIIFVGEVNIVTMPKDEVIELIRKHESSLTLEIFRPIERLNSKEIIDSLAMQSTPVVNRSFDLKRKAIDLTDTPKSHKPCNFKHPKICFQPTIGSGVIV